MITTMIKADGNAADLRRKYGKALYWVVGDVHGEVRTLQHLMEKIQFDPENDRVYFLGDYHAGGNPAELLKYISEYYCSDYSSPGFHLIRGNHERELSPMYPLENMPDCLVIRGRVMNYYLVHAGMVAPAFELINADMSAFPEQRYFAYRLTERCAGFNAPLRQLTWSLRGLYSQHGRRRAKWPNEDALSQNKSCIIHGHTPYSFFSEAMHSFYGEKSLFWQNQHIWFSEDLQSFNIDSNIKGRYNPGDNYRGLTCLCLNVIEDIAEANAPHLKIDAIEKADNFAFTADYVYGSSELSSGNIEVLLNAAPEMKTIDLDSENKLFLKV